jgi:TetR/AcrR family transcriptional regulator
VNAPKHRGAAAPRRRKVQQRALDTRDSVLIAALREFATRGLGGARVESIASRAGVNKQALYYHYGNKEALFQAALAYAYGQFHLGHSQWSMPDAPPTEAMRDVVAAIFDHVHRTEESMAVIGEENRHRGIHLTAEVRKQMRTSVSPLIDAIRIVLERGQRLGVFSRAVELDELYLTIIAMSMFYFTNSFTLSAILGRDLATRARVAAWKEHVISFVLAALRSDAANSH